MLQKQFVKRIGKVYKRGKKQDLRAEGKTGDLRRTD